MKEEEFYKLLSDVLHGDQEHRDWLTEAFNAAWERKPVPLPRGSGTKDRLYNELLDTQRKLSQALKEIEQLKEGVSQ
jgi:hypothetical protein